MEGVLRVAKYTLGSRANWVVGRTSVLYVSAFRTESLCSPFRADRSNPEIVHIRAKFN